MATSTSSSYTRETFLPYLSSAFYAAISSTSMYFGTNFINPNAVVMNGTSMPPELLQDMGNGEVVRVKVLIPPGAEYANFTVDTGQSGGVKWGVFSQDLSFCGTQASNNLQTCISAQDLRTDSLITGTLANYQGSTAGTNTAARYAYIVLQAGAAGFRWANVTINMNINNTTLYTPWRNARTWAGGTGAGSDCDALGTTNCTASSTTPTTNPTTNPTTTAFSLTPATQQLTAGSPYTLTVQNGTLSRCFSGNAAVSADPVVATTGATAGTTASGTILNNAVIGASTTITCQGTAANTSATATVTVAAPTVTPSTTAFSLTGLGISKLAATSATFSATVNAAATGYWVAVPSSTLATPTTAQIKAGQDVTGAAAGFKGSDSMTANLAKEFTISGLSASTSYQVYFYAEDASGNKTSATPISLVTNAASSTSPAAITSTVGGTGNAKPILDATIVPAANDTGAGNYYIAAFVPEKKLLSNGVVAFLTSSGWKIWAGGALLPYAQETLKTTKTINILDGTLDVSTLTGTDIYAGYGVGGDSTGLNEVLVAKKIYTVK